MNKYFYQSEFYDENDSLLNNQNCYIQFPEEFSTNILNNVMKDNFPISLFDESIDYCINFLLNLNGKKYISIMHERPFFTKQIELKLQQAQQEFLIKQMKNQNLLSTNKNENNSMVLIDPF